MLTLNLAPAQIFFYCIGVLSLHLVFQGVRRRLLLWGEGQLAQSLLQVGDEECRGSACLGEGKVRDREPNSATAGNVWDFWAHGAPECTEQPCLA